MFTTTDTGSVSILCEKDILLPLQLLSFTANHNGKTNIIKWSATEAINTDNFIIQRSGNSKDFVTIGYIKSLNNGKQKIDYSFVDQQPVRAINFYRLKRIDKDGKYSYSNVRSVKNASTLDVSLYPNPVHQTLTLNFSTEKEMKVQLIIYNTSGKQLIQQTVELSTGIAQRTLNISSLSSGNYFIQITGSEEQQRLKFIKK